MGEARPQAPQGAARHAGGWEERKAHPGDIDQEEPEEKEKR